MTPADKLKECLDKRIGMGRLSTNSADDPKDVSHQVVVNFGSDEKTRDDFWDALLQMGAR